MKKIDDALKPKIQKFVFAAKIVNVHTIQNIYICETYLNVIGFFISCIFLDSVIIELYTG